MTRQFSIFIYWSCSAAILITPLAAAYLLWDLNLFSELAREHLKISIQWGTVEAWQWYSLWVLAITNVSIGLVGFYFLRQAFQNFSKGEFFNLSNSVNVKKFSIFLFLQVLVNLLTFPISSLLLSINHPADQKMLVVSINITELKMIILAMIFWVLSSLLVEAAKLQTENRQFI